MMLKRFQQDRDIFLYCDLHGHSRKKNIFMCDEADPDHGFDVDGNHNDSDDSPVITAREQARRCCV